MTYIDEKGEIVYTLQVRPNYSPKLMFHASTNACIGGTA